jgi:hypothetical protein
VLKHCVHYYDYYYDYYDCIQCKDIHEKGVIISQQYSYLTPHFGHISLVGLGQHPGMCQLLGEKKAPHAGVSLNCTKASPPVVLLGGVTFFVSLSPFNQPLQLLRAPTT